MEGRGSNYRRYAISKDINNDISLHRALLHQSKSPHLNPYYSENHDSLGSGLINYLHTSSGITHCGRDGYTTPVGSPQRSRTMLDKKYSNSGGHRSSGSSSLSPLASLENLDLSSRSRSPLFFSTLSKGDDDVLVMDGISAGSISSGGSMSRTSSYSGSSSPSSFRSYKSGSQACMGYATNGYCQYRSSCKFSHSPAITPNSTPTTAQTDMPVAFHPAVQVPVHTAAPVPIHMAAPVQVNTVASVSNQLAAPAPIHMAAPVQVNTVASVSNQLAAPAPIHMAAPVQVRTAASVPIQLAATLRLHTAVPVTVDKTNQGQPTFIPSRDWSPEDDNIEVTLPSSKATPPTREEVDRYIGTVLYGSSGKRRLELFTSFCPE